MSIGIDRTFQTPDCAPRTVILPWCDVDGRIHLAVRQGPPDSPGLPHADDGEFLVWDVLESGDSEQLVRQWAVRLGLMVDSVRILGTWESPKFAKSRFVTTVVLAQTRQRTHFENGVWWGLDDLAADVAECGHYWGPMWAYISEAAKGFWAASGEGEHRQSALLPVSTDHLILDKNIVIFPVVTPTLAPATHTNCVVIGHRVLAVVDPATPYPDEQARLVGFLRDLETAGARVAYVLLTHHHRDHIGAVTRVVQEFGATVWAHPETTTRLPHGVVVDHELKDGQELFLGSDDAVTVLHTPGHAPGHCVFWNRRRNWMVLGDMVAGEGTIVVAGADGDMAAYVGQLERLASYDVRRAVAAHGPVLLKPAHRIHHTKTHRIWRESIIFGELMRNSPCHTSSLTRLAYPGVADGVLPLAEQQLLAHLAKLEAESAVLNLGNGFWTVRSG